MLLINWCFDCKPSSAHLCQGLFSVPCSASEEAWPGQLTRSGQRDIPCHGMSCSIHKLEEVAMSHQSLLRNRQGTGQWVVNTCMVHHLFLLGFTLGSFSLSLNYSYINPQNWHFSDSSPHVQGKRVSEPLHGTLVLTGVKPQDLKLRKRFPKPSATQVWLPLMTYNIKVSGFKNTLSCQDLSNNALQKLRSLDFFF